MHLSQVKISGFRNFKSVTVNLNTKTLLIGPNDIGKSNFVQALRLLLDRGLSDLDVEPKDSDFYAFEDTNEISINLKFENVIEECVLSRFKGHVSSEGVLFLRYLAMRESKTGKKNYQLFAGHSEENLHEVTRAYTRAINLRYIDSNRDLFSYIRHQKKSLLEESRERRSEGEKMKDEAKIKKVGAKLEKINKDVGSLTYIKNATANINEELDNLSFHNSIQSVQFDSGASAPEEFIDNLQLVSRIGEKAMAIGGDGRNNQIFLAIWASRHSKAKEVPTEVTLYCIEEPEAHLHPHQQRKLAEYLAGALRGQVLITTHSPQIACEFPPGSIVRLYRDVEEGALAANEGCSIVTDKKFCEFGYRLNILPAEAFFSNVVFLVEGPSEVLFYKSLARECNIDLDRLNISILMVDGVGFQTYVDVLEILKIPVVVRTDNDINGIPRKKGKFRCAGVERALSICSETSNRKHVFEKYKDDRAKLTNLSSKTLSDDLIALCDQIRADLESVHIFLSNKDLETDLANSAIAKTLKIFFGESEIPQLIGAMQERKATSMFEFLAKHGEGSVLKALKETEIAKPLLICKTISEQANAGTHARTAANS